MSATHTRFRASGAKSQPTTTTRHTVAGPATVARCTASATRVAPSSVAMDILAFFTRPDTSSGPSDVFDARLKRLRGIALSFRNLTRYIARGLLETGGFDPQLRSRSRRTNNHNQPDST